MASKYLLGSLVLGIISSYAEKNVLTPLLPEIYEQSHFLPVSRAYGLIILILLAFLFWLTAYGLFVVGMKRNHYKELAKKDGEKEVEERYSLPNLYVDGNSKHARAFNCVQRSHQQVFESLHHFVFATLVAGLVFPIVTSTVTILWFYARVVWSTGYASSEGKPGKRYENPFSRFIWIGLIVNTILAFLATVNIIAGYDLFW